jgi:hypothetical protein
MGLNLAALAKFKEKSISDRRDSLSNLLDHFQLSNADNTRCSQNVVTKPIETQHNSNNDVDIGFTTPGLSG